MLQHCHIRVMHPHILHPYRSSRSTEGHFLWFAFTLTWINTLADNRVQIINHLGGKVRVFKHLSSKIKEIEVSGEPHEAVEVEHTTTVCFNGSKIRGNNVLQRCRFDLHPDTLTP